VIGTVILKIMKYHQLLALVACHCIFTEAMFQGKRAEDNNREYMRGTPQDDVHLHLNLGHSLAESETQSNKNPAGKHSFENREFGSDYMTQFSGQCSCGKPPRQRRGKQNRISGGSEAQAHQFPWMVRIVGGCVKDKCGGTLISPRLVASAYHCSYYHGPGGDKSKPCDHSDNKRLAVLGHHKINLDLVDIGDYYTIPIIEAKYPNHGKQVFTPGQYDSHDFVIFVLKTPARLSSTVQPICLPVQGQDFSGEVAIAAGWGMTTTPQVSPHQSPVLMAVNLTVDDKKYKHYNFFGTRLEKNLRGVYKDPCRGDSGGPLMYLSPDTNRYVLVGTVQGQGYDCKTDKYITVEGSNNGLWNKVSNWVDWIRGVIKELEEPVCTS